MKIPEFLKINRGPETPHCCHETKDGTGCNATPQTGKKYCFFHDPKLKKKRAAARRDGGLIRSRTALLPPDLAARPLHKSADVAEFLGAIMNQVCLGRIDIRAATGLAYIATALMQAMDRAQRDQERAAFSAAAESAVKSLLAGPKPPAGTAAESAEEQPDDLAASLFSDCDEPPAFRSGDRSPFDKVNLQIVDKTKDNPAEHDDPPPRHPKPNGHAATRSFSPTPKQDELKQHQPAQIGVNTKPIESAPVETAKAGQQDAPGMNAQQRSAPNTNTLTSQPISPPARQNEDMQDKAKPGESFAGIPGLAARHINYMNFSGMPVATRKRVRINPRFVAGFSP